jgi:hypothetical protein
MVISDIKKKKKYLYLIALIVLKYALDEGDTLQSSDERIGSNTLLLFAESYQFADIFCFMYCDQSLL